MRQVLMLAATSAVLALGMACEEGGGAAVPVGMDCPQPGYVTPSNAQITINRLVLTGLPLYAGFDGTADYDGQPAACFNPDTNTARLEFTIDDLPAGVITVGGTTEGSFDLNGADPTVRIEITNEDGVTTSFGAGSWQTGTGFIVGTQPLDVDVSGYAVDNASAQTLDITFTAVVTP